jgi:hypothetical protein
MGKWNSNKIDKKVFRAGNLEQYEIESCMTPEAQRRLKRKRAWENKRSRFDDELNRRTG